MAKTPSSDDYTTGRPATNEQMKALRKAHGEPVRQAKLPPFVGKSALPIDPDKETD